MKGSKTMKFERDTRNTITFMTMSDEAPRKENASLIFRLITFTLPIPWADEWVKNHTNKSLAEFFQDSSLADTHELYLAAKMNNAITEEY